MDSSDPMVMKFAFELKEEWRCQSENEKREDVMYHPPPPHRETDKSDVHSQFEDESTLAYIMKKKY